MDETYDVVVLAGGAARRLGGGTDKPALTVGGITLLDRVLAACTGARAIVVVGPERPTTVPVHWVREQPPGGGPVAAVAAALPVLSALPDPVSGATSGAASGAVLLLAADLPFFDRGTAAELLAALADPGRRLQAAVLVDADGRDQPLAAAYRVGPLRAALDALLAANGGDPSGLPLRRLVGGLATGRLADRAGAALDCDTWDDLDRARRREQGREQEREQQQGRHGGRAAP